MDDIIALLAREAGKKFEEAQKAAVVEAARRNAAIVAAQRQAARGPASAGKTAAPASAPAPVVQAAPVPAAPPPPVAPPVAPLVPDGLVLPEFAPPPHPSLALLAAFTGGTSLLSGIVLSEALAPPISLRKGQLFDRLQR